MNPRVEFDLSKLNSNLKEIKKRTNNINYLFPVKCCGNSKVLDIISNNGFGFDVSNKNEYTQIKEYLTNQFVSVSGPLSYELADCDYSNIHIVSNSLISYTKGNGIRINFNSNKNMRFSRFGIDYKEIDENTRNEVSYVHFHSSDYRNLDNCNNTYEEIKSIIKYFPNLKALNIGGHIEHLTFDEGIEYLNTIRGLVPNNIKLYAEIGDFLFKDVGTLYAKVIDIRRDDNLQIVTLNFMKMASQRWTYPIYIIKDEDILETIFCGCSCCESDIYLETKANKLNIGDEVIFKNISPYSYEWNSSFGSIEKMKYIFK